MASVALPISILPHEINPSIFAAQNRRSSQVFQKLVQPAVLRPSPPKMNRPGESQGVRVEVNTTVASSVPLPVTPKRKRKSLTEPTGTVPEVAAKKRKTGKDTKRGQSPEKTGEESELSARESYPDPRWMNDPQNYPHLRDHKYKYISKITNKLLDDPGWRDQAKAYQDQMKKKTGNWSSLSRHLYPQHEHIPPCVNPLELIIEVILKHGASTPEDRDKEPSIRGCFFRLMDRLGENQPLVNQIKQEVTKTIRDRERTTTEEPPQQESPAASVCSGPPEELKSPSTLEPGSPHLSLDMLTGLAAKQSVLISDDSAFEQQDQMDSPSSSHASWSGITAGSGSPQAYGDVQTTQTGYTGNIIHNNVRGYTGPLRNIGHGATGYGPTNRRLVNTTGSPRIRSSSSHGLRLDSHIVTSPGLPSPLSQSIISANSHDLSTDFSTSPVQTNLPAQVDWAFSGQTFASSQDQDNSVIGTNQFIRPFGPIQDPFNSEYHTPEEHSGLTFTFGPQGPDMSSLNLMILDETQYQSYMNG